MSSERGTREDTGDPSMPSKAAVQMALRALVWYPYYTTEDEPARDEAWAWIDSFGPREEMGN